MKTITGTSHFKSKDSAIRYYGADRAEIERKIAYGEISIGPPKYDAEKFTLSKNSEGRYVLTDK